MWNFTTTTVISSNKDYYNTDEARIQSFKEGVLQDSPEGSDKLVITRHAEFDKKGLVAATRAPYVPAALDVAVIDLSSRAEGKIYRVAMYIQSVGNADPMFANTWVKKGRPLFFEFNGEDEIEDIVKKSAKYLNLVYGGYGIVKIEAEGDSSIKVTASNEYMRFKKMALQEMQVRDDADFQAYKDGQFVDVKGDDIVTITPGNEGMGTYTHIMKDLRLPTGANTRWYRHQDDEVPYVDGNYDQYVLTLCKERNLHGLGALGQKTVSETTHVFYVLNTAAPDADAPEGPSADFLAAVEGLMGKSFEKQERTDGKDMSREIYEILAD